MDENQRLMKSYEEAEERLTTKLLEFERQSLDYNQSPQVMIYNALKENLSNAKKNWLQHPLKVLLTLPNVQKSRVIDDICFEISFYKPGIRSLMERDGTIDLPHSYIQPEDYKDTFLFSTVCYLT